MDSVQNEGKVHTIDFTMNVTQGTAEDIAKAEKENEGGSAEHAH
jgi:hypothetical protein